MKIEYKIAQYNSKLDFHFKKWYVLTDKLNKLWEFIFVNFWVLLINERDFGVCTLIRESAADMILSA